ncbi:hypothetical protein [Maritimibacter fusiformis]|uniref:hypothetical protein n=1 Tax=Maritimibacter fusiformis TaxID=2603819 RepID=UPI001651F9B8|nr:hypothetical protein [Maritimibacter fusiformis]
MIEMTPTSMEGIAALIHVLWSLEGPKLAPVNVEANHPNCKLMGAIWRYASGQNGLPPR